MYMEIKTINYYIPISKNIDKIPKKKIENLQNMETNHHNFSEIIKNYIINSLSSLKS